MESWNSGAKPTPGAILASFRGNSAKMDDFGYEGDLRVAIRESGCGKRLV